MSFRFSSAFSSLRLCATSRPFSPILRLLVILLLPVIALLQSCTQPEKPVTPEEAAALSRKIEAAAVQRNPLVIDNIFDEQSFGKRVASEAGKPLNKDLVKGAIEGFRGAHLGQQIIQALGNTGTYLLVKQYEKDQHQHLLFRLFGQGSVNYHDYELAKYGDDVKAVDLYIYLSGENLSQTLSTALMGMQDKMSDMSKEDLEKVETLKTIRTLMSQGEAQKASDLYDQLPAPFKKQKLFQLIHVQIAQKINDSVYSRAMDEYRALYPSDPNMYLMMIDAYVLQKNYPMALESVNKLDSFINKDPFQDYYRGLIYKLMRDTTQSRVCFERLHQNMPHFSDGTIELIANYTVSGEMDKATQLARQSLKDSTLSQSKLDLLYNLHPDLKAAMTTGN